jgi:hypothetical protein
MCKLLQLNWQVQYLSVLKTYCSSIAKKEFSPLKNMPDVQNIPLNKKGLAKQ